MIFALYAAFALAALRLIFWVWRSFSAWRVRRATVQPKCPACGRLNESRVILARLLGSGGQRHGEIWRADENKLQFTCWSCGAIWGEVAISESMSGVSPKSWSHPRFATPPKDATK